jgi:DNA-binding CsgD family transcriptional regulator
MMSEPVLTLDDLYRAARYTECLRATEGDGSHEARLIRARIYLNMDMRDEVLSELDRIDVEQGDLAATVGALRCRASLRLRNWDFVDSWLASAASRYGELSAIGRAEVAMARGLAALHRGRVADAVAVYETIDADAAGPLYRAWQMHLIAGASSHEDDYRGCLQKLGELAEFMLETPAAFDVYLLARAAVGIANFTPNLFSPRGFEFAVDLEQRIPWTADLHLMRFIVRRALAWGYALYGSDREAHRTIFELADDSPPPHLRTLLYYDRAELARTTGSEDIAEAFLELAIEEACQSSWESDGEQRIGLLGLTVLAADRDEASARTLLEIYDAIKTPLWSGLALAHGSRLRAHEDHARGAYLSLWGDAKEAKFLLTRAHAAFTDFGYGWRAASIALRLHALTGDRAWLRQAEDAVAEFPDSAIAGEIRRRARGAADPRLASLSPAQRRVFEQICHGKSNKEIASALKISVNTARNHVAAVLVRFDAHSRAHLAAVARESGLLQS